MDLNRAIEFIEGRERFALALSREQTLDCLAAAEALVGHLEKKGKQVGLLLPPQKETALGEKFSRLKALPPLLHEFVVSLDSASSPITQLRYEKSGDRLDIVFSPKSLPIDAGSITFRPGRVFCDALITLGVADVESLNAEQTDPEFFLKTPSLNIDHSDRNKKYGEVNLVSQQKPLSETVYKLISPGGADALGPEDATLLLAGILGYYHGLVSEPHPDSLLSLAELVRLGGNWQEASNLWRGPSFPSLTQLFGRATVRSKMDETRGILWSFLTAEDLEKTKKTAADIPATLDYLKYSFPPHRLTALLWQNPTEKTVEAVLSGERRALDLIASREEGEFRSPHFALAKKFSAFVAAEEYLSALFNEVLF